MIEINLIEQSVRKGRGIGGRLGFSSEAAGGSGSPLIWVTALLVLAANCAMGWMALQKINEARSKFQRIKADCDVVQRQITSKLGEAAQVRQFREVINNQMDVLRTLDPPDRILWCEKFNMLANLVPSNVFLTEVEIKEDVKMVETDESVNARERWEKSKAKDRAKKPEIVNKPVIKFICRLTGLALGADNVEQFNNVMRFHQAMVHHEFVDAHGVNRRFMDGFNSNIEFEAVEATVYEGAPVNRFIFKLTTIPSGVVKNSETADSASSAKDGAGSKLEKSATL